MTKKKPKFLLLLAGVACLVAGAVFGITLERRLDRTLGPALLFTTDDVRLSAEDDWTRAAQAGPTVFYATHRLELKNISDKPVTIRVPPQVAVQGMSNSAWSLELAENIADAEDLVLKPTEKHVLTWKSVAFIRGGLDCGLVYYQLAVSINGELRIMGAKSNLTLH